MDQRFAIGVELVSTILLALAGSRMLDHVLEGIGTGASSAAARPVGSGRGARAPCDQGQPQPAGYRPKFAMALSNRTTA